MGATDRFPDRGWFLSFPTHRESYNPLSLENPCNGLLLGHGGDDILTGSQSNLTIPAQRSSLERPSQIS